MPSRSSAWPALALVAVALGGCVTAPAAAPREAPSVIAVRGTGRVSVKPDTVLVHVGVEARAPSVADATADVNRRATAMLARVKALGVAEADIVTVAYTVNPVVAPRQNAEDPTRILAYHASNLVGLRIRDLAAAGRILDEAMGAGANFVSSLQFTLGDPTPAESQARALAVRAAEREAKELAAAAGVQLGEVLSIEEDGATRPILGRGQMVQHSLVPAPVEAGELEIAVSVQVRYRIGAR
jgi:hypothetical protein